LLAFRYLVSVAASTESSETPLSSTSYILYCQLKHKVHLEQRKRNSNLALVGKLDQQSILFSDLKKMIFFGQVFYYHDNLVNWNRTCISQFLQIKKLIFVKESTQPHLEICSLNVKFTTFDRIQERQMRLS
jgi:hypothetical protein